MSSSPYAPAAKVLNEIWTRKKGLKTVVYSKDGELKCSTSTYAICCHVLKHKDLLGKLLKKVPKIEAKNQGLLYILLFELFMGPNKKIRGGGALKRQLMSHFDTLQIHFQKLAEEEGWKDDEHIESNQGSSKSSGKIPRYVRINTLLADRDEVIKAIRAKSEKVYIDPHIPDLLVLDHTPQSRALLQDLVVSKKVILQDKSSCFSALCMVHGFGTDLARERQNRDYLDACAAPGNKTSHLAALLSKNSIKDKSPTIHALDKSPDRYKLLKRRMGELVPNDLVRCHNEDFFEISKRSHGDHALDETPTKDFKHVRSIMLDPSCSGSGMSSNHTEESVSKDPHFCSERIQTLSNFQFQALHHATTDFPNVDRVVYSTCSLYVQENEKVVQRLLASNDDWELISPACLKTWHRRGLAATDNGDADEQESGVLSLTPDQAKCLIRVHPDEDGTNGFFVACFQRKSKGKSKSQSKTVEIRIDVPDGMELYKNQFHTACARKQNPKPTSIKDRTKGQDLDTAKPKRKANEISSSDASDPVSEDKPRVSLDQKLSKKRAKKLEWKKRQRLKKEARLKAQLQKKTKSE